MKISSLNKKFWDENVKNLLKTYSVDNNDFSVEKFRIKLAIDFFKSIALDNYLLDIGCGTGEFLKACSFVKNRVGIDSSKRMIAVARISCPGIKFEECSIEDYDAKNKYNAVTAFSVLPYIEDDTKIYLKLNTLLKSNGLFIASYPNLLFNMFTDNELTYKFMNNIFYDYLRDRKLRKEELKKIDLKEKAIYPVTSARGKLFLREENPLEITAKLSCYGFKVLKIVYLNIHPLKPRNMRLFRIGKKHALYNKIQFALKEDWRGNFLASTFMIIAKKGFECANVK